MDISIIIPVYNSGKYLPRCLDSILTALVGFDGNGEIILVDNNSTDESSHIIKKYQQRRPNIIRIFKCIKPGAAAARNYGFKKAKGEYIWFVDADDSVANNSIAQLIKIANKKSADLVMMGAKRIYSNKHTDYLSAVCPSDKNYKSRFIRYGIGPWQLLIRKSWWQNCAFKFYEGIIHEDMELISALILYTNNFACINEPLYNYFQNPESVLHKSKWDSHYFDIFTALIGLHERFAKVGAAEKYHNELEWFFIWNLLIDSAKDFGKFTEGKSGFELSRQLLRQYYPNWRKNIFLRQKPLKLRGRILLNYYRRK